MAQILRACGLVLVLSAFASPSHAGMSKDLASCTAADGKASAAACTRVMESGRLWKSQHYIGYYNRGWSYYNDGDNDRALADFNEAIARRPPFAESYYSRAAVQHERGERQKSLDDLDRYLKIKGDVEVARFNRAVMFRKRGEPDRAMAELQAISYSGRRSHNITVLEALILSDLGEQSKALNAVANVIATAPDDASAYYARAVIEFRGKALGSAVSDGEKAVSLNDTLVAAHTLLGRIAEERGNTADATRHYERAIALPAKTVDARAARAEAREQLKGFAAPTTADAPSPSTHSADCRRYVATISTTIAVDCDD